MRWTITPSPRTFRKPLRTAAGTFTQRPSFLVSIEIAGVTGWGEATPLPEFGGEGERECLHALKYLVEQTRRLSDELSGRALTDSRGAITLLQKLEWTTPTARFAIETALFDLAAQQLGTSIANLLNPNSAMKIAVNALADSPADARACVEEGFRTLKIKVGVDAPDADIERVRAIRNAVGESIALRIDANAAWSEETARHVLQSLPFIELCEQPVRDLDAIVRLASAHPIGLDEGLAEAHAKDSIPSNVIAVIKPALVGGITQAMQIAKRARAAYVTSGFEGPIGRAAAAHIAAALPAQTHAHGLAMGRFFDDAPSKFDPREGFIHVPAVGGLGVTP